MNSEFDKLITALREAAFDDGQATAFYDADYITQAKAEEADKRADDAEHALREALRAREKELLDIIERQLERDE